MYDLIRKIHLYSASSILLFLLMYFVTGYPIIHGKLLANPDPVKTTRTELLPKVEVEDPEAFASYLQETFDLRGQRAEPRQRRDGSWQFRYFRPGTLYDAVVKAGSDSVRITENKGALRNTLIGFHRLHGYHGGGLYSLWAFFYDLASLSLIVFVGTGIYMWYTLMQKHLLGWIFLGVSFLYSGVMVVYLIYAP